MGLILKKLNNSMELEPIATLFVESFPNSDRQTFLESLKKHSMYLGFKGIVAYNEKNIVVGFAYGYTSLKGQYYRSLIEKSLSQEQQYYWLHDCFEFVELCVKTSERKKGIGSTMHNALLENLSNQTAILTTQVDNIPARAMYKRLGWEEVKEPFYPGQEPYVILGKRL